MANTGLIRLSATELAAAIGDGEVTATEVVEAHLDRIETRDEELNAFVTVTGDTAREAARAADEALESGEDVGPLHGVPLALKDLKATKAGTRHTYGSAPFADNVAEETAAIVERLEDAGAIVIGKTNTPEFGHAGTTDNAVIGPTASPVDPSLNAGGSSGGSAAAVGAGMVPMATGSDAGGSLRIPAAACGVYGFKPTFGLVPDDTRPTAFGRKTQHVTLGPLTRTVEDAARFLDVTTGQHPGDPSSVPVDIDWLGAPDRPIDDWTIAYSPDLDVYEVDEEVRTVVEEAVAGLEAAGATVETVSVDHGYSMPELSQAVLPTFTTALVDTAAVVEAETGVDLRGHPDVSEGLQAMLAAGSTMDTTDVAVSGITRTGFFDAVQAVLAEYDLLVTPTLAESGFELEADVGTTGWEIPLTWPFNWTGHPVASAPAGLTDAGHPVGVQLVGRRFADDDVLAASAALERERPWDDLYED
ncbi:MAG: amidase [Natrialbaceae archaeon]